MKNNNNKQIKSLATETYSLIFKLGCPPPNLLLRDYARSIIEYSLYRKIKIPIDYDRIKPPYKSNWIKIPTKNQIERLRKKIESAPEPNTGGWSIFIH